MKTQKISNKQLSGNTKYLYQRLDNSFGIPFTKEMAIKLGLSQYNTWTTGTKTLSEATVIMDLFNNKEIGDSVKNLVYYNESDNKITKLIEFINSKRFLTYTIGDEKLFMFIPSSLMEKPFEYPKQFTDYDYSLVQLTHYNPIPENRTSRFLDESEVKLLKAGKFDLLDKDEFIIFDGDLVPSEDVIISNMDNNDKNLDYTITLKDNKFYISNAGYRVVVNRNQSLNYFSSLLFQAMISYHQYQIAEDDKKDELLKEFLNKIQLFRMAINKKVYSKEFKNHFQLKFKGYSGVITTSNCGIDEIEIPRKVANKLGISIGDYVLVYRDPVQNVFVTLKVVGFTDNEIRMNPLTILILDGDCDGDKVQFIPIHSLLEDCRNYLSVDELEDLRQEFDNILPSNLLSYDSNFYTLSKCYL